ncbi:CaiB/BaiF CoA-transferase family protein [uncultured Dysosmobacter sp.]|uniref:CaiB/BaiF CoA transferase family protein n=1 Tax=uncultured Dysosmobacter sp. TaxID=2591384 RepID=UPI0026301A89|nr:CoA transferase [uncultured Dysosmobacter sp.]
MENAMALSNIRVLDLTRVMAGPYCTMYLADLGAEVIKIEIPGSGDDTRKFPPFQNGESLYYCNVNRNKKGVTLNLKRPAGKQLFMEMVKQADVVVENYRPGVMDKLGLGYDVLKEINPRIIYGAVSGFGSYGPLHQRPGYDIIAQAMSGLMSLTGECGGGPIRTGSAIGDLVGGLNLTIGILAALNARQLTGKGQRVDISLVDGLVSFLETNTQRYLANGVQPPRMGNRYPSAAPYDSFKAKDGEFVIGCGNDKLFALLCSQVLQRPELSSDPRYDTPSKRLDRQEELKVIIEAWAKDHTIEEAVNLVLEAGVPAAPIYDIAAVMANQHIAEAREMFLNCDHPTAGHLRINGNPVKLMDSMPSLRRPAPSLGQDNEEVYENIFGVSAQQLEELKAEGAI